MKNLIPVPSNTWFSHVRQDQWSFMEECIISYSLLFCLFTFLHTTGQKDEKENNKSHMGAWNACSVFNNSALLFDTERVFQLWYNIQRTGEVLLESQKRAHSIALRELKYFQKHDPPPSLLGFT